LKPVNIRRVEGELPGLPTNPVAALGGYGSIVSSNVLLLHVEPPAFVDMIKQL
jgi:hypothetical protein